MLDPNAHLGEFHRFDKFPYAGTGLAQKKNRLYNFFPSKLHDPAKGVMRTSNFGFFWI
jgi:hypothetical protein